MSTAGRSNIGVASAGSTSSGAAPGPAPKELFARLIDDAAIFPPGNATLAAAVSQHRRLRAGHLGQYVGPLLCAASRLAELGLVLDDEAMEDGAELPGLDIAVVVDTATSSVAELAGAVQADDRLDLQGVEVALRGDTDLGSTARRTVAALIAAELPDSCAIYVEVPLVRTSFDALDVLSEYDLRAKLRTGGADAAAFPDEAAVAAFLNACLDRELALKCTAGLHHAVRHTDPTTGFEHHGFLNVLLATHTLIAGATVQDAVAVLAERDGEVLADTARALSAAEAARARRSFASYGSCSVTEPIDDLASLALLPPAPVCPASR